VDTDALTAAMAAITSVFNTHVVVAIPFQQLLQVVEAISFQQLLPASVKAVARKGID